MLIDITVSTSVVNEACRVWKKGMYFDCKPDVYVLLVLRLSLEILNVKGKTK